MRKTGQPERGVQLERVLREIILMSQKGVTFAELAERFSVDVKTARRDLEVIERSGIPVYEVDLQRAQGEPKRFRVDSHFARSIL
jgi:predicted DNA-binding transcriptional regulator YafY